MVYTLLLQNFCKGEDIGHFIKAYWMTTCLTKTEEFIADFFLNNILVRQVFYMDDTLEIISGKYWKQ